MFSTSAKQEGSSLASLISGYNSSKMSSEELDDISALERCNQLPAHPNPLHRFNFLPSNHAVFLALSFSLTSYLFSIILDTDISWEFSSFFDDSYNFLQFPQFNSLFPPKYSSISQVTHLYQLLSHKGLNVYEPAASLWKAGWIDLIGLSPRSFRALSATNHVFNGFLLYYWLQLLSRNTHNSGERKGGRWIVVIVAVFLLHPLSVEAVGWLSAFSYLPALSFSLLSSICLEKMIAILRGGRRQQLRQLLLLAATSLLCLVIGSLCKAPGMMLAVVHCSRCLCLLVADVIFPVTSQDNATSSKKAKGGTSIPRGFRIVVLVVYMLTSAVLFFVVLSVVTHSNSASNPDIHSTDLTRQQHASPWRIVRKAVKAVRVVGDFIGRAIMPSDLRIHYQSPSESEFELNKFFASEENLVPALTLVYCVIASLFVVGRLLAHALEEGGGGRGGREREVSLDYAGWVCWGVSNYVICLLPGTGLVHHGWSHLGGDRYNYLPLAYVTPALLAVACWAGRSNGVMEERADKGWLKSLDLLRMTSVAVVLVLFTAKSRQHLLHYSSDDLLLRECVKHDSRDWECLQHLGDLHGTMLEHFLSTASSTATPEIENIRQQYEHYNRLAMTVIEEDFPNCPRLQMFLATLQVSHASLQSACQTVERVLIQIFRAVHSQYSGLSTISTNEKSLLSRLDSLLSTLDGSSSLEAKERKEAYFSLMTSPDLLGEINVDLLPLTVNNALTCHIVQSGLTVDLVQIDVMPVFEEVLKLMRRWNETNALTQSNLLKQHVSALEEHLSSLRTFVRTGGTSYQGKFLH